jgi:DNA-binding CsgD family transcriptional regulator
MRLRSGPLRVRLEASEEIQAQAEAAGLVLVAPGEEADLVARPDAEASAIPLSLSTGLDRRPGLSPREIEVLECLVDGWSNAEIASLLGIGVRTVRFHLGNIYATLGVSRRGEAAREALRLGVVRLEA